MKPILLAATAAAVTALATTLAMAQENPTVGGAPMYDTRTIVENAANSADHTTLVSAVQAAGLVDTLSGEGPFTVFAPTNAAFDALPEGTVESLMQPENREQLRQVLTCHVLPTEALWDDIHRMVEDDGGAHPVATLGGCEFTAHYEDGMIQIEDGQGRRATVTIDDVRQSNGVIHVIDTVLLPAM